jgi:hypothetical protein
MPTMSPALPVAIPGLGRASAAAAFATIVLLQTPAAQAGEVTIRNCLHDFRTARSYDYSQEQNSAYGSARGGSSTEAADFTVPSRRGFASVSRRGRDHRDIIVRATDRNGGIAAGAADAEHGSGYDHGYTSGSGNGSESGNDLDSCVEIRRELTNPYVIQISPAKSAEETRAADERDRLWRDRCKPVVKQDARGVSRYVYAASGCDYGKYE